MSEADGERHITEAEYRAWLEHQRPRLADQITALLPQEARDAGMRFEWDTDQPDIQPGQWRYPGEVRPPCYRTASGMPVHFTPSCRCLRL